MTTDKTIEIIASLGDTGRLYGIRIGNRYPVYVPTKEEAKAKYLMKHELNGTGVYIEVQPSGKPFYLRAHEFAYVEKPVVVNSKELNAWTRERAMKGHMITFIKGHNGYEDNVNVVAVCEATDEYFEYHWGLPETEKV